MRQLRRDKPNFGMDQTAISSNQVGDQISQNGDMEYAAGVKLEIFLYQQNGG